VESPPPEGLGFSQTVSLVHAAQRGDSAAVEALFARYLPRVRQIVALRVGRRLLEFTDCEDLVQDALMKAFQGLAQFELRSEGSFRSWLASLVENTVRSESRRRATLKRGAGRERVFAAFESGALSDSVLCGHDPTPSKELSARELEQRLEQALLALKEPDRRVIELRRLCGMDYEEIASELGLRGASSARSLFSRAMNRLSLSL
jgi:RNA polymerase sigma-70 factor (subfamily 1)